MIEGNDLLALLGCLLLGTIVAGVLLGASEGKRDALWFYAAVIGAIICVLWVFVVIGNLQNMLRTFALLDGETFSWREVETEMACIFATIFAAGLYQLSVRLTRALTHKPSNTIIPMS